MKLISEQVNMGRIIINCRKYDEVTALYQFFKHKLDKYFTHPRGPPVAVENKLVDMYTHCTHSSVKDKILAQFLRVSPLRVVIASIDFGMGIDCHDVRQTIHWGVSEDVEMYIQESGRAGRDGLLSCCVLLYSGRDLDNKRTSSDMIAYCTEKDQCRRCLLFKDFESSANCVKTSCCCRDVCTVQCRCGRCQELSDKFIMKFN